jgi:hypothetical protein
MMTEAGFTNVRTVHLPGNLINCYHLVLGTPARSQR